MSRSEAFQRIPSSIREQAINASAKEPGRKWFVNFDNDFHDFFISPFFEREISEDGQITVGVAQHGNLTFIQL